MFPAQRINELKKIVKDKKTVDIGTLCEELGVSDVTVRKYLDELEKEGFLKKFYGGAMLNNAAVEDEFDKIIKDKNELDTTDYEYIADLAVSLIEEGETIFLGQGELCSELAKKLYKVQNLTVLTNNINAVKDIVLNVRKLYFIGGEIMIQNGSIYSSGNKAIKQLDGVFVQKSFIGVDGIDLMSGVTVNDLDLLDIIERIITISKQIVVLAEHSKYDKISLHRVGNIDSFKIYVSDKSLDEKYKKFFFENDIKALTSYNL